MDLQIGLYVEAQEGVTWHDWQAMARRAEDAGLDCLACSAHLMPLEAPGRWSLDIWPALTAVALWTERICFGPEVLPVTFNHPAQIARMAAALDRLSGGRFQLGLGAGRDPGEHRAFGLPFPPHDERVAMLAEAVEVIRRLWSGEPVSFDGTWYRLAEAEALPAPANPWLGIGGNSEPSLRLAAERADEWSTTSAPVAELAARNRRLDELARAAGREPHQIARTIVNGLLIGRDDEELERRADRMATLVPRFAGQAPWAILGRLAQEWGWWVGTPEDVLPQVRGAVAAGFDRVYFQVYDVEDAAAVDLLVGEVAPALRHENGDPHRRERRER